MCCPRVSHSYLDIPRLAEFSNDKIYPSIRVKYHTWFFLIYFSWPFPYSFCKFQGGVCQGCQILHWSGISGGKIGGSGPPSILLARVKTSQTWRCCGASSRRRSPPPSSQLQAGVGRLSGWCGLQNVNEMLLMMGTRMLLHFVIKSVPGSGSEWKWVCEVGIVWYPCHTFEAKVVAAIFCHLFVAFSPVS